MARKPYTGLVRGTHDGSKVEDFRLSSLGRSEKLPKSEKPTTRDPEVDTSLHGISPDTDFYFFSQGVRGRILQNHTDREPWTSDLGSKLWVGR
jgi:hypothetical protein